MIAIIVIMAIILAVPFMIMETVWKGVKPLFDAFMGVIAGALAIVCATLFIAFELIVK